MKSLITKGREPRAPTNSIMPAMTNRSLTALSRNGRIKPKIAAYNTTAPKNLNVNLREGSN
jgi:hypothetical protein